MQEKTGPDAKAPKYLSIQGIANKIGSCERTAQKLVREPWWPSSVVLSPRVVRWIESEVDAAIAAHAPRREKPAPEPTQLQRGKDRARIERAKQTGQLCAEAA